MPDHPPLHAPTVTVREPRAGGVILPPSRAEQDRTAAELDALRRQVADLAAVVAEQGRRLEALEQRLADDGR